MKDKIEIWHNNVCSTSRKVLQHIETENEVQIVDYIKNPPSVEALKKVLKMMDQPATYILRKKDKVFQELFEGKNLSNDEWIEAMHKHPSIIERPIVIIGKKAYLARPFEEFKHILEQK